MKKVTLAIKKFSGKFKVGEEVKDSKGEILGQLEEMAEDSIVITLTAKGNSDLTGEISGSDSGATALIGEPDKNEEIEFHLDIHDVEGAFEEGEKIYQRDNQDVFAVVKKSEAGRLIVLVTPAMIAKLQAKKSVIVGEASKANAKVGYPFPAKKPDNKDEGNVALAQLAEQVKEMKTRLDASDKKNKELIKLSESQGAVIEKTAKERAEEKRDAHYNDIERWSDQLKESGMAPAVIDELGLITFARILDSKTLFQFAEDQEKKTLWDTFSELMSGMVKRNTEGTLFVPQGKLGKNEEKDVIVPVGVDPDAAALDTKISKYQEDHKDISYLDAYKIVTDQDSKK